MNDNTMRNPKVRVLGRIISNTDRKRLIISFNDDCTPLIVQISVVGTFSCKSCVIDKSAIHKPEIFKFIFNGKNLGIIIIA